MTISLGNVIAVADQVVNDLLRSQVDSAPYALLGDVSFAVLTYFDHSETHKGTDFAEHKLLGGKPRLQWVGDKLDTIKWRLMLHVAYCNPEAELQKLQQLLDSHTAAPLYSANGDYQGTFVVTDCRLTTRWTFDDGTLICFEASVDLKEYVVPPAPATQTPSQTPVAAQQRTARGAMNPPGAVTATPAARSATAPVCRN